MARFAFRRPGLAPAMTAALLALSGPVALGQGEIEHPSTDKELPAPPPSGMPQLQTDCRGAEDFGGTDVEKAGYCAVLGSRYVSARTLADRALAEDERSFRAHFVMGYAQHFGEANLPKALFHLERAEAEFEERYGKRPDKERSPWRVYYRILLELLYVHGEMDHHLAKIEYVDAIQERLDIDYSPRKAWALLKLERFDEARAIAKKAAQSEDEWDQAVGLTALCAVESELRNRQAAYEACKAAARRVTRSQVDGAVELSNAAAASEEIFEFGEAERLYLEAARRRPEGSVNPWGRLVRLYLRQGRMAEALSSWRLMRAYRASRSGAHMDQQDQSEADLIGAAVLLAAGRPDDAEAITQRTVQRPDRQGTSSAASDQNEGGAAIMDRVAKLTRARKLEEDASIAPWSEALGLRASALRLRYLAWQSGRRAAEILANRDRLYTTLRPECPGSLELPSWLDAEAIALVGPGVALAAIELARAEETLPEALAGPIFDAFAAEAYLQSGDDDRALQAAQSVVARLPFTEAMHRARAAAIGARAAWNLERHEEALRLFQVVLAHDPAVIRRLGLRLPIRLVAIGSEPEVQAALDLLEGSPRFEIVDWGFVLTVGVTQARLTTSDGTVVTSMFVPEPTEGESLPVERRIARAVHARLLAPEVDITQSDIRSLDGSLGVGGRAADQVDAIMEEVREEP